MGRSDYSGLMIEMDFGEFTCYLRLCKDTWDRKNRQADAKVGKADPTYKTKPLRK
jgi:hypothetical protein